MIEPKFKLKDFVDHKGRKAVVDEVIPVFLGSFEYVITYSDSEERINYVREEELKKWTAGAFTNTTCSHPNKYKNVLSANLKFYVCPDCKRDLGDVE